MELDPDTEEGRALIDAHYKQQFASSEAPESFIICRKRAIYIILGLVLLLVLMLWLAWYLD